MINILKVKSVNDRRLDIIERKTEYEEMKTNSKNNSELEKEDYEGINIRCKKYDISEFIINNSKKIK